jgi:hypothetical protein
MRLHEDLLRRSCRFQSLLQIEAEITPGRFSIRALDMRGGENAPFDGVLSMVPSGNPGFDMLASALEDLVESWKRTRDDDGNVTATPYERPLAHKV